MAEDTVVTLPQRQNDKAREYPPVDEGDYCVIVPRATKESGDRVRIEFQILDEGPFAGRRLFQTFSLNTPPGLRSFESFLNALGLSADADGRVDVAQCRHKVLRVTVKHHERDNKVYANVTTFAKAGP